MLKDNSILGLKLLRSGHFQVLGFLPPNSDVCVFPVYQVASLPIEGNGIIGPEVNSLTFQKAETVSTFFFF